MARLLATVVVGGIVTAASLGFVGTIRASANTHAGGATHVSGLLQPAPRTRFRVYPSIAAIGNSLTEGAAASTTSATFPEQLAQMLSIRTPESHPTVWTRGDGGFTTGMILNDLQTHTLHPKASVVVIEAGTNDFQYNNMQGISLSTFQSNFHALLAYIRHDNPRAALVCLDIWQDPSAKNHLGEPGSAYNAIITSQCAGASGQMADESQLYLDPLNHWSAPKDTYHPNDRGHRLIAQAILMAMPPF